MTSKRPRTSKTPRPTTTPLTVDGAGSVLALYFHDIRLAVDREQWSTRWANDAATEFGVPKTTEQFAATLKAALAAGIFKGIDECRAVLPDGLSG